MKTFLALYVGDPASRAAWDALAPSDQQARAKAGMAAWHDWMTKHADVVAFQGGPVGKTKLTSKAGVTDVRNAIGGFVVVRAESHEAAARLFENHPHFSIMPGTGVEVMELLPVPTPPG